ncbi:MAG: MBL fold metallo-hydrolase [Candidatus Korarchaeota archaeon]
MKVNIYGSARTVGGSAILVKNNEGDGTVLLDYGVYMRQENPYPPLLNADITFITHAHLDHSGAIPLLGDMPIIMTPPTYDSVELLLYDSLKLNPDAPFGDADIERVLGNTILSTYNRKWNVGGMEISLFPNGHIPGSFGVVIEGEKTIVYTSDISLRSTQLTREANLPHVDADLLIIESTYFGENHPNRQQEEREFVRKAMEVIERGGIVLVPAFGVARSQEILCILERYSFPYRVYLDGMGKDVAESLMARGSYLRDHKLFKKAMNRPYWMEPRDRRRFRADQPCLIVTTAGMMQGGPVAGYMEHIAFNPENAVFLVGYQVKGTDGRRLLETGMYPIRGKLQKVHAQIEQFVFSCHSDTNDLIKITETYPEAKVVVVHGEEEKALKFAEHLQDRGRDALAPAFGDVIEI